MSQRFYSIGQTAELFNQKNYSMMVVIYPPTGLLNFFWNPFFILNGTDWYELMFS